MIKVDERLLIHKFIYEEFVNTDRNHTPVYKKPVTISNCRIDSVRKYSRDGSEKKITIDCIIFCYASYTVPFLRFKEQSKIVIDYQEYIIDKVIPVYEPYKNTLFSYELEVS